MTDDVGSGSTPADYAMRAAMASGGAVVALKQKPGTGPGS